jgi:hypothetical protein
MKLNLNEVLLIGLVMEMSFYRYDGPAHIESQQLICNR